MPVLPPPVYGFAALRYLKEFISYRPEEHTLELAIPASAPGGERRTLSEYDSGAILREYGIPTPEGGIAASADEAASIADRVGYPVAMKVASADIPHKSDIGGVMLNLKSADEAQHRLCPDHGQRGGARAAARVDGVFVQKMLKPGLEVIIGVNNDPQFGPAVLVGLGGVFVEIFRDTALLPAPFDRSEAGRMLESLKAIPLFRGYRGKAPLDLEALADMIAMWPVWPPTSAIRSRNSISTPCLSTSGVRESAPPMPWPWCGNNSSGSRLQRLPSFKEGRNERFQKVFRGVRPVAGLRGQLHAPVHQVCVLRSAAGRRELHQRAGRACC